MASKLKLIKLRNASLGRRLMLGCQWRINIKVAHFSYRYRNNCTFNNIGCPFCFTYTENS